MAAYHQRFIRQARNGRRGESRPNLGVNRINEQPTQRPGPTIDLVLTKKYFKLLQAVHHTEILTDSLTKNSAPPGMVRQVDKLTAFIKPSSPNQTTLEKVKLNTLDWMNVNMSILREHYDQVIAEGIRELGEWDVGAFDRAVSWAKTRYKRKFTISSVETLRSLLHCTDRAPVVEPLSAQFDTDFPPLPSNPQPPKHLPTAFPPLVQRSCDPQQQSLILASGIQNQKADNTDTAVTGALAHNSASRVVTAITIIPEHLQNISFALGEDSFEVPLPEERENGEVERDQTEDVGRNLTTVIELHKNRPSSSAIGNIPRVGLRLYSNVVLPCDNDISPFSPSPPPDLEQKGSRAVEEQTLPKLTTKGGDTNMMMGHTPKDFSNQSDTQSESPHFKTLNLPVESAPDTRPEPTRHPNTNRKTIDWTLRVDKPIAVLGDSNLSRIPTFRDPRVQVDSFPGATFHHIREVLKVMEPNPTTEKLVLSFGLNNCLRKQVNSTTWKQLQQLLKTCEVVFPNAEVFVPIISYSDRLDREQQHLLKTLNLTIMNKCSYLPDISRLRFKTDPRDPVHWTKETASEILDHWLDQLNM